MQRAIDSNNITLAQHLLQTLHAPAPNLLLNLWLEWLIIVVQQLLAIKRLQPAQHSLTNASDRHSAYNLALEVILILRSRGDVPVALDDLLVGGHEIADQHEDGHEDVFSDRDDVRACHFGDRDAAVGGVGGVEVDVIGTDTGGDSQLELLRFGEALGGEVARVEAKRVGQTCTSRSGRAREARD